LLTDTKTSNSEETDETVEVNFEEWKRRMLSEVDPIPDKKNN
jgi:hypothetical protein